VHDIPQYAKAEWLFAPPERFDGLAIEAVAHRPSLAGRLRQERRSIRQGETVAAAPLLFGDRNPRVVHAYGLARFARANHALASRDQQNGKHNKPLHLPCSLPVGGCRSSGRPSFNYWPSDQCWQVAKGKSSKFGQIFFTQTGKSSQIAKLLFCL
jgi:hypothetical protein